MDVLIEGDGVGHSANWAPIAISGARRGDAGLARAIGRDGDRLRAGWA